MTNLLTQRSDKTRKDVLNDANPEVNLEEEDESTNKKDKKSKKKVEKEKEPKKEGLSKPKVDRQARRPSATNLEISNVANLHARSKSKTRKVKERAKSPSGRREMEWDGKKWKVKGEKDKKKDELYDAASDKSEMSFMDSKHQDILMDKLLG